MKHTAAWRGSARKETYSREDMIRGGGGEEDVYVCVFHTEHKAHLHQRLIERAAIVIEEYTSRGLLHALAVVTEDSSAIRLLLLGSKIRQEERVCQPSRERNDVKNDMS